MKSLETTKVCNPIQHFSIHFLYFSSRFSPILKYPIAATPARTQEAKVESHVSSNPTRPHCFLTQCPLNPEASHTNVLAETLCTLATVSSFTAPQEPLERDGMKTSLPAKPSPNPDDAGPIVRHPTGIPVAAGWDRAWTQTPNL